LKNTNARNLSKPVNVDLRTKENVAKNPDERLKWIKGLNPGHHIEHWRVPDKQPEPRGQRLILLIDRDSQISIKQTGYRIYTGLS
jgi:hypothetical protein